MINSIKSYPVKVGDLLERYKIKDAVFEMMNLARAGNKYFNDSEPWISVKQNKEKCATTLNICLNCIYTLAELFEPVIPYSSEKIFKMLNAGKSNWDQIGNINLNAGHQLSQPEILFTKIEDNVIEKEISKLGITEAPDKNSDEEITIEEFKRIKLRVALIKNAERVPKSEKLLKLKIEVGNEERQLIAGIAKSYQPEELIGRKVLIVANLKPAKLFGLDSQGMILAVDTGEEGKVKIVEVDGSIAPGTLAK